MLSLPKGIQTHSTISHLCLFTAHALREHNFYTMYNGYQLKTHLILYMVEFIHFHVKSYITTAITTGPLMVRDVTVGTLTDYKHTYKFCMKHFTS
jgi:transketolase